MVKKEKKIPAKAYILYTGGIQAMAKRLEISNEEATQKAINDAEDPNEIPLYKAALKHLQEN